VVVVAMVLALVIGGGYGRGRGRGLGRGRRLPNLLRRYCQRRERHAGAMLSRDGPHLQTTTGMLWGSPVVWMQPWIHPPLLSVLLPPPSLATSHMNGRWSCKNFVKASAPCEAAAKASSPRPLWAKSATVHIIFSTS